MLGKTHIALTDSIVLSSMVLTKQQLNWHSLLLLGATTLGAVSPDVDTSRSILGRHVKSFARFLNNTFGHRTVTHNIFVLIVLWGLTVWYCLTHSFSNNYVSDLLLGFDIGYTLHIIEDSFSIAGILWFYPFQQWSVTRHGVNYNKRHYHRVYEKGSRHYHNRPKPYFYKTGGTFENSIYAVSIILLIIDIVLMVISIF